MRRLLFAALAALPLLAYGALKTPAADRYLLRHLPVWAAGAGVDLTVETLDFDPWGPSLALTGVAAAARDGSWRASVDSLGVRLLFLKSLAGAVHLELRAEAPRVTGALSIPQGGGGGGGSSGGFPRLVFETLRVQGGSVELSVPAWDLSVALPSLEVDWVASRGGGEITGGRVTWRGATERLERLSFRGRRRFAAVQVEEAVLETQRVRASARGKVGPWGLLDLETELRLAVADLPAAWIEAARLTEFRPVEADGVLRGRLTGSRDAPEWSGRLTVASGRFGPVTTEGIEVALIAKDRTLGFRDLVARTNVGSARDVEGKLTWEDGLRLEARGEAEDYDLRGFMALFLHEYFPVGVRASGSFEAAGPLWPQLALECRVDLRARALDVTTREGVRSTRHFALPSATVTSRCTVGVDELRFGATRVETPSATVTIREGRIEYREGLWFDTDVALRDLDLVRQYVPAGFSARGKARGRFGGPYRTLRFEYDLDFPSTLVFGVDVGRLRSHATYDLSDLVVSQGRLDGPLGRLDASGRVGLRPDGTYELEVEGRGLDLSQVGRFVAATPVGPLPEVAGTAWLKGTLGGPLVVPVFDGSVGAGPVTVRKRWRVEEAELEGSASTEGWVLRRGTARAYGATAAVEGRGDVQGLEAAAALTGVSLERLEDAIGTAIPARGIFTGTISASGPYRAPHVDGRGRLAGAVARGYALGDPALEFHLAGDRLTGQVSAFEGSAVARAEVRLAEPYRLVAEVAARDLPWSVLPAGTLPPELRARSVSGDAQIAASLGGSGDDLSVGWNATVADTRWEAVDLGTLRTDGEVDGEGLRARISGWDGEARVAAAYPNRDGAPLELEATFEALDLQRLGPLLPEAGGRASGHGRVLLSLGRWSSTTGLGRLQALSELTLDGRLDGLVLPGGAQAPELTVQVRSPGGLPRLEVVGAGVEAEASVVDLAAVTWKARARCEGLRPAALAPPNSPLAALEGTVTATATARGRGASVAEAAFDGVADAVAYGRVGPSRWTMEGNWRGGKAELTAREPRGIVVRSDWVPAGEFSAEAVLNEVPLGGLLRGGDLPAGVSGSVDGRGSVLRTAQGDLSGDLVLTRLEVSASPVDLRNQGDVRLRYRGGELRVEHLEVTGEGLTSRLGGSLRPGERWDLEAEGSVDLAALRRWVPGVRRASGTARGRVTVQGPWDDPTFEGPVEIRAGATVQLEKLAYPFEDLDASVYLRGDQGLTVEWVDAQFGSGRIHLEGAIGLDGLQPGSLRLAAEIRDVRYESPPQVSYGGDADLLVTGTAHRPEIRGEIRVKEFLYERRLNWKTMVFEFLERQPRQVEAVSEPGTVFVDVSVRGDEDLKVQNNLADLSLEVDLRARGYLPRPTLWGRVSALDGTVRFRSQEYEILQSAVEFLGETQPVPLLDVHARAAVREHTVSVDIVGPLDDYQVTLTSVPPLSQTDIVALLTLGTTSEEVGAGQSVTAAEAASFLTGRIQDELETEVGGLLGFDQLQIDPVFSPAAQTTVPRITVGKTVTKDLRARYSAAIGGEAEQDLEVQYTLSPRVSLLGTWSDQGSESKGSLGGEVRFRFTFR